MNIATIASNTGDFMKKVPKATCALWNRHIVSNERVHTASTFYMKSAVSYLSNMKTKELLRILWTPFHKKKITM